jgi:hypothetical protein
MDRTGNNIQPVKAEVDPNASQTNAGKPYDNSGAEKVEINPQPLPPGGTVRRTFGSIRPADIQINPQPLPPKNVKSSTSSIQPANVQINPQPLPPKTVKSSTGTIQPSRVQINPQPLPPKATHE